MDHADDPRDQEADRFFDALAAPPGSDEAERSVGARRLREAVLVRERVLRDAEGAHIDELDADERRQLENIRRALVNMGALPEASDGIERPKASPLRHGSKPRPGRGWLDRLQASWAGWRAGPSWALAASLVVGAVVVVQLSPPEHDDSNTLRGEPPAVLSVQDPAASAERLAEELRAVGAQVVAAPLDDERWALHIEFAPQARAGVESVARARGLVLAGEGPFIVHVGPRR